MAAVDPAPRPLGPLFDWLWNHAAPLEWYALEEGSPVLRDATERLVHSLTLLDQAFQGAGRPARRGPLLAWTLQHVYHLETLLEEEAGDPSHPLDALRQLRAALGALEDQLEIEARRLHPPADDGP